MVTSLSVKNWLSLRFLKESLLYLSRIPSLSGSHVLTSDVMARISEIKIGGNNYMAWLYPLYNTSHENKAPQ